MTEFASIMHMDSLFYCSMRKSCLRLCKTTEALPQVISRSPYFLNGKYVTKKNFVLYRTNKVLTHRA
jgi:hypothetical protein